MLTLFGNDPATVRLVTAAWVVIAYLFFCAVVLLVRASRQRASRQKLPVLRPSTDTAGPPVLIVFASQTGFAEHLAWQSALALQTGHSAVDLTSLGDLTVERLQSVQRALFVVATTGEGDAPDSALRFVRKVMPQKLDLSHLHVGVLALGDSSYTHVFGFGRTIDAWLQAQGAHPLFARVEVDNGDRIALARWQVHVTDLSGVHHEDAWSEPPFAQWELVERTLLNPGSVGGEAYHVVLRPVGVRSTWQAGDIAEVQVPTPAGSSVLSRDYSIASLPSDGQVELLVRRMTRPDGTLGFGSACLTRDTAIGGRIAMRIRANRNFHAPAEDRPLILIGNGTGLAGLRAHLKHRAEQQQSDTWLVFGERNRDHDYFFRKDIEAWQAEGALAHVDLAFSRDQEQRVYVQDVLKAQAVRLQDWVQRGATLYVCGSLEGMSAGVDGALTEILGAATVRRLREDGLYRRDVY